MPIYALGELVPAIDETAYVHPDAVLIGEVQIGPRSSVWPSAVLRGDDGAIIVGARTSIQDGCVLHAAPDFPTVVEDDCVIGHLVHLEGCRIGQGALIGNGAVVLERAVVRGGALVGSGAVVPAGMDVPSGAMALGIPARVRPSIHADAAAIASARNSYLRRIDRYRDELRLIG